MRELTVTPEWFSPPTLWVEREDRCDKATWRKDHWEITHGQAAKDCKVEVVMLSGKER